MAADGGVSVEELGWESIRRQLLQVDGVEVTVGPEGARNERIGAFMEFGTVTVPARPFLGTTLEEQQEEIATLAAAIFDLAIEGRLDPQAAFELLGLQVADMVKATIRRSHPDWPPLAPKTVKRKGSDAPLIDTAQLLNSIRHRVEGSR